MSGRILIVDDVATNRIVMKVKLAAAQYDVLPAASGAEAIRLAREGGIDLIIMDMMMPGMTGAEACAILRADADTAMIPIIIITASDDNEARMQGLSAGADDFLAKPVDELALLARVRSLLRSTTEERDYRDRGGAVLEMTERPAPGMGEAGRQASFAAPAGPSDGRIALIGSAGASWLPVQRDRLSPLFRESVQVLARESALALPEGMQPDLFVIDADLVLRNDGMRLMSELRSRRATRHAAFVMLLPAGDSERAATALDLGASDVSYHPVGADELAMRIRTQLSRKRRADHMRSTLDKGLQLAVMDPLTGLHNRRYALHQLDQIATRCRAQSIRAGVVMMDVDHFKQINDQHGHPVGDHVLARVAQCIKDSLRAEDVVARIGGEEFLAILPDADLDQVRIVAERLRANIEEMRIRAGSGPIVSVTMSMGVSMLTGCDRPASETLIMVDRALYQAKDAGRNQVTFAL